MNTDKLLEILNDYLQLLQNQAATSNEQINEVKLLIWALEDDIKLQRYLNNLTVGNRFYRR